MSKQLLRIYLFCVLFFCQPETKLQLNKGCGEGPRAPGYNLPPAWTPIYLLIYRSPCLRWFLMYTQLRHCWPRTRGYCLSLSTGCNSDDAFPVFPVINYSSTSRVTITAHSVRLIEMLLSSSSSSLLLLLAKNSYWIRWHSSHIDVDHRLGFIFGDFRVTLLWLNEDMK